MYADFGRRRRLYGPHILLINRIVVLISVAAVAFVCGPVVPGSLLSILALVALGLLVLAYVGVPLFFAFAHTIGALLSLLFDAPFRIALLLSAPRVRDALTGENEATRHYEGALAADKADNIPLAVREYEAATRLDPKFAAAYCNLGFDYGLLKNPQQEIRCYEQAIAINPNYVMALTNLAITYEAESMHEPARGIRQKLRALGVGRGDD
jgi:tetratricopeptide (TPR) repeat protein